MRTKTSDLVLAVVPFLGVLAACHPARPPATAASREARPPATLDPDAVDRWLASEVRTRGLVGVAVVVVKNGQVVLARGYGTRTAGTREPVTADTPFAIGSVSKEFTCAAAMTLVDDGRLTMQDSVASHYPALTRAAEITLDDLAAHVSGYRDYYPLDFADARMASAIAPDDLLTRYATLPLDFDPRSRFSYSNIGYVLLGRIVERVAARPARDPARRAHLRATRDGPHHLGPAAASRGARDGSRRLRPRRAGAHGARVGRLVVRCRRGVGVGLRPRALGSRLHGRPGAVGVRSPLHDDPPRDH